MSRELIPTAGRWYRDLERDETFKVVSVDEDDDLVEIQHADGEMEDLESAEWFEMDLERIEQPEDWLNEAKGEEDDDEQPTMQPSMKRVTAFAFCRMIVTSGGTVPIRRMARNPKTRRWRTMRRMVSNQS